jgi:hypothetical protein
LCREHRECPGRIVRYIERDAALGAGERARFDDVHESFRELVHAAGVVHVRVGSDRGEGLFEEIAGRACEARESEPRVDQQIAVAAAYVPDIAPQEPVDVRLRKEREIRGDGPTFEPAGGNGQAHWLLLS